jgi:hypothetical protein
LLPSAFYGKTAHKSQRKSVVRFISLFVTSEIAAVQVADHSSLASALRRPVLARGGR